MLLFLGREGLPSRLRLGLPSWLLLLGRNGLINGVNWLPLGRNGLHSRLLLVGRNGLPSRLLCLGRLGLPTTLLL